MYKMTCIALLLGLMICLAGADTPTPVVQTEGGKKSLARIGQLGGLDVNLGIEDKPEPKKEEKKPEPKKEDKKDKKPEAKKEEKKPEPKKEEKKPEAKKEEKKPEAKKDDKKPEPKKDDKK